MAQIEQNDGGKKKKGAQKKMHIHVDFTPMVDMNMLLITFFMLCTTMIKSQTLQIALPAPVDPNAPQEQQMGDEVKESQALTMIVDTQRDQDGNIMRDAEGNQLNIVYYYEGFEPKIEANGAIEDKLKAEAFIPNSKDGMTRGIRNILYEKNKTVVDSLKRYKIDFANEKITKEEYDSIAKIIRNNNKTESPKVSIKAADNASWESVIAALDEMQINQISQYRIAGMTHNDTLIIEDYNQRNPKK